jgi:glycosyltransferase involved in cell wall biosynthesis
MSEPIKIGIYRPSWLLARHNTDYSLSRAFERIADFEPCEFRSVSSIKYTATHNASRVLQKLRFPAAESLILHGLNAHARDIDVVYHYGTPPNAIDFFKNLGGQPVVVTTGFMTDRYVRELYGKLPNRQDEADKMAKAFERADKIHFHTHTGRESFLNYRPEFAPKAVSIPFFLPNLSVENRENCAAAEASPHIQILFVGYEGRRKGLDDLTAALNALGPNYLRKNGIRVKIISRDRPDFSEGVDFSWNAKLAHAEVLAEMRRSDIFVLVPRRESYGLVLVEAMAAGCAIITDDDEPRAEIVGNSGIKIPPASPEKLTIALRELIEMPELRKALGRGAIERVAKYFLPSIVSRQYLELFRTCAPGSRAGAIK